LTTSWLRQGTSDPSVELQCQQPGAAACPGGHVPRAIANLVRGRKIRRCPRSREAIPGHSAVDFASRRPVSSDFRRELSLSDNRIGEAYSKLGRHDDALASFQAALDIRQDLASATTNAEQKRDLALAYERLATSFYLGNRKQAGEMYAESLAIRTALAGDKPEDPDRREDLASPTIGWRESPR